jgi:hypothetical protein
MMISNGNAVAGGIIIGLGYLLLVPLIPIGLAHMTMPVTWPGWVSPYCARTFFKVAGPTLYWVLFSLVALLPYIASSTVSGLVGVRDTEDVINTVRFNSALFGAMDELKAISEDKRRAGMDEQQPLNVPHLRRLMNVVGDPAVQRLINAEWIPRVQSAMASAQVGQATGLGEIPGIEFPFQKLILPAVFLVLNCATLAAGIVFCMRMNGLYVLYFKRNLDLITMTREKKYVAKEQKVDDAGQPVPESRIKPAKVLIGLGGTLLFYAIANGVLYFASGGEYILLPRPVAKALNLLK